MESTDINILSTPEITPDTKEARKKQEKDRKKGEKKMDQFIKSIANCTSEEKVEALCKKNSESLDEIRTLKSSIQLLQRKIIVLEKEKEQLQNEQSKGVLARSRLEALCRELQRQNKSIKDESMQKIREEEEKRKEVSTRFQTALNEVSVMMQQNTDKNLKLRDDNIEISNKFQKLCDQFKQREDEVVRLTKQMNLEKQLAEATVKRIECQLNAERGLWSKEKEHYAGQIKFHEEEKLKFENNIKSLEDHLSLYSNKYSDFESTIQKSNEVFDNYKVELNKMSKQIQKLEQENNAWKEKWIQSQHAFTNVTLEHRACEQNVLDREKKLKHLADLCRTIQEERSAYLKQLKENGLTPVVVVVEKEKPVNSAPHKMTKKEKQLSLLKKEMQVIEKQLADTLKSSQNGSNETQNLSQKVQKPSEEQSASEVNSSENVTQESQSIETQNSTPQDTENSEIKESEKPAEDNCTSEIITTETTQKCVAASNINQTKLNEEVSNQTETNNSAQVPTNDNGTDIDENIDKINNLNVKQTVVSGEQVNHAEEKKEYESEIVSCESAVEQTSPIVYELQTTEASKNKNKCKNQKPKKVKK